MNRIGALLLAIISMSTIWAAEVKGYWKGNVMTLPIVFHVFEREGCMTTTLDSPSQGAKDIPCELVYVAADSIAIRIPVINASFKGKMSIDGNYIEGVFTQGLDVPVKLTRTTEEAAKLYRPQEPQPPFVYNCKDVEFSHDGITLAGTLTTPAWGGRFPAVVLISGSGAQNRDEEIMGHKPFAVIADYLTRSGFAVLRYDDRGVGGSSKGAPYDTTIDFVQDVIAAIDFLKTCNEVDSTRIGLLGHSEGGTIAMICASQHPEDVSFVISLAGMMVKGKELMVRQNEMIATLSGHPLTTEQRNEVVEIFSAIAEMDDVAALADKLREIMLRRANHSAEVVEKSIKVMTSPWYISFVRLDPARYIENVKCPIYAVNGEWDVQVDANQNLEALKMLQPDAEIKSYARMNHLFQEIQTKAQSMSYGAVSQTISPVVLSDVADWLMSIFTSKQ